MNMEEFISKKHMDWLRAASQNWCAQGVIDEAARQRILANYRENDNLGDSFNVLLMLLALICALLGVIMFFAYNWPYFSTTMRDASAVALLLIGQACYASTLRPAKTAFWQAHAPSFAALALAGALIGAYALAAQSHQWQGDFSSFCWLCFVLLCPVFFFGNDRLLPLFLLAFAAIPLGNDGEQLSIAVIVAGLGALLYRYRQSTRNMQRFYLLLYLYVLLYAYPQLFSFLSSGYHKYLVLMTYLFLLAACVVFYQLLINPQGDLCLALVALPLRLGIWVNLMFVANMEPTFFSMNGQHALTTAALLFALGLCVYFLRRRVQSSFLCLYGGAILLNIFSLYLPSLLNFVIAFALMLLHIAWAAHAQQKASFVFANFMLCCLLITRLISHDGSFLWQAVMFIVLAMLMLLLGFWYRRARHV